MPLNDKHELEARKLLLSNWDSGMKRVQEHLREGNSHEDLAEMFVQRLSLPELIEAIAYELMLDERSKLGEDRKPTVKPAGLGTKGKDS